MTSEILSPSPGLPPGPASDTRSQLAHGRAAADPLWRPDAREERLAKVEARLTKIDAQG